MSNNQENEKQYLAWYYESLKAISKMQSRLAWILFIFIIFSLMLIKPTNPNFDVPFINLPLPVKLIQLFIPLALSLIFWTYLGSMRAASIATKNIKFRLKNLSYKESEFSLYDIDTSLNFIDLVSFNFKKFVEPGSHEKEKKYDWRHFPYFIYAVLFLSAKIYTMINYEVCCYAKVYLCVLIILDFIFAMPLISNRIKRFFIG